MSNEYTLIDTTTLLGIKDVVLSSPRSPMLAFIGSDAKNYYRIVQSVLGQIMQQGDINHIAMLNISATNGITTNFDVGVSYLSPLIPTEEYEGEFVDRLITFYKYGTGKLDCIFALYDAELSDEGLQKIGNKLNMGSLSPLQVLAALAAKQRGSIDPIKFSRFIGSRLPILFFVNHNSISEIFPRAATSPQATQSLIRAFDLLDDSINALTSNKSFGEVQFRVKTDDEETIIGYSNFVVFALDIDDINENVLRREYAYVHKAIRPNTEQRSWIIAGLLEEKASEYIDAEPSVTFKIKPLPLSEIDSWQNNGGRDYQQLVSTIAGSTAGLDSTQLEQAVLKGIELQVRHQHNKELKKISLEDLESLEEGESPIQSFVVNLEIEPFNKYRLDILSQYDFIKIPDTTHTLDDVAGHTFNKDIIRKYIIELAKDPNNRKNMKTFMTLVGVPGTGKTYIMGAIANELKSYGFIYIIVLLSALKDSYVGSTEKKTRLAFEILDACGLAVIFFDELDMITSGRQSQGDSGVSSGIHQSLMKWSENKERFRGEKLISCATNRPDQVEEALYDRFSRDGVLNFAPLDKNGIAELVRLKLTAKEKENVNLIHTQIASYEEIGKKIYDLRDELMGRPLVSMIEWIHSTALIRARETDTTELLLSTKLVEEFMGQTTSRGTSEKVEEMKRICESYAFFLPDAKIEALLGKSTKKVVPKKKPVKKKPTKKKIDMGL